MATFFPMSVDINPTAKCNLQCDFCWGPDHDIPDGMSLADWKNALNFMVENGTRAIVVTGGEPLLRKDLESILAHAKGVGLRVTLSTNCLLLQKVHDRILPFVDDIGIPLDGSTAEMNQKMRLGNPRSFGAAIAALPLLKALYPQIEVTIRTVVSQVNAADIYALGSMLATRVELFNRWKLYQFAPFSIGALNEAKHTVDGDEFLRVVGSVRDIPKLMDKIDFQPANSSPGRYVFIGPLGDIYGVSSVGKYIYAGSFHLNQHEELLTKMSCLFTADKNWNHAMIAKG